MPSEIPASDDHRVESWQVSEKRNDLLGQPQKPLLVGAPHLDLRSCPARSNHLREFFLQSSADRDRLADPDIQDDRCAAPESR